MFAPKSVIPKPAWGLANEVAILSNFSTINRERETRVNSAREWFQCAVAYTLSRGTDVNNFSLMRMFYALALTDSVETVQPYLDAGCSDADNIHRSLVNNIDPELARLVETPLSHN